MKLSIRESVDSIFRNGADTSISLNKCSGLELPNADGLSLFIQATGQSAACMQRKAGDDSMHAEL